MTLVKKSFRNRHQPAALEYTEMDPHRLLKLLQNKFLWSARNKTNATRSRFV